MIAKFLTSRDSKNNYSFHIGEIQKDRRLPIWCEDEDDDRIYTDIHLDIGDIEQLIYLLDKRKGELLDMEE